MSYEITDGLGFSLKPPKWLRKAQPGKILKKIALPIAAVGATLLIPGAAPLVGAALKTAVKAVPAGIRLIGKGTSKLATALAPVAPKFTISAPSVAATIGIQLPIAAPAAVPDFTTTAPLVTAPTFAPSQPSYAATPGGGATVEAAPGAAGAPPWGLLLGAGAVLLFAGGLAGRGSRARR
jgi:hypothetical protein